MLFWRGLLEKKADTRIFRCLARLYLDGKQPRDNLPDFAALNAQSTRHAARPGPKTCAVVYRRPPRVPLSREREKRHADAGEMRANVFKKQDIYRK